MSFLEGLCDKPVKLKGLVAGKDLLLVGKDLLLVGATWFIPSI